MTISIGTAGWAIGKTSVVSFPADGTSLERYASVFSAVEINSSFHRPHRDSTWQRWRDAVPEHFRFSVKIPRAISHEQKLLRCEASLDLFLEQVHELGDKLSTLLLQLPPKLEFDASTTENFFTTLRSRCSTQVVFALPRYRGAGRFRGPARAVMATRAVDPVLTRPAPELPSVRR
jgi:uncharacterized protein YecE (DUF72 family)